MTGDDAAGAVIIRFDLAATTVFAVSAIAAAVIFEGAVMSIAAAVSIVLFFIGIVVFLWAFWNAVQRSRDEQVAVTQLYLLTGGVAPRRVRIIMLSALAVQCVVGLGTAIARPNAVDGSPGNSLALGVLVPILGFGLNGLWAAFHGRYQDRLSDNDQLHRPE